MGNCGVGIAPCKPEARELLIDDLVNVEGMGKEVLSARLTAIDVLLLFAFDAGRAHDLSPLRGLVAHQTRKIFRRAF